MLALAYYINFLAPDGKALTPDGMRNYQNFFIGEGRTYDSSYYLYAPFVVSGDLSTEGSEKGQAEIWHQPICCQVRLHGKLHSIAFLSL